MITFRHILCPVDFSETSSRALQQAHAIAAWYEASLTMLHVVSAVERADTGRHGDVTEDLLRFAERAGATTPQPAVLVDEGAVHEAIVRRAASWPADLLVIGTHGRSGFNRLFLGSVTEKVIRTAACPVLTVPPQAVATTTAPGVFRNILCATDFSPSAAKALELALDLGRQSGGSVTVLHAIEYMEQEEPCEHVDEAVRRQYRLIVEHARETLRTRMSGEPRTWCDIKEVVAVNRAYREILQRASSSATDLIVMGAQGTGGVGLMLYGSNTEHVVRAATCPVLTVRG